MSSASMVFILTLVILAVGTAQGYGEPTKVILLTNSIDYGLAQGFVGFLKDKGFEVTQVEAAAFDAYKTSQFIVILGGPDAPDGVGEVVQEVLTREEQDYLRAPGNKGMYVKNNTWAQGQRVFILAGSDRTQTREAHIQNRESLYEHITTAEQPQITPPSPLPAGSKTIYAGEYTETISYWGYERTDGYTTIRLQTRSAYPLVYFTFRELPATIRLEGNEYDVLYYDDEKIIIKRR